MCGRFTITGTDDIVEQFELIEDPPPRPPRFNIAPTQQVPVISNRGERRLEDMRWGLIPHWADDVSIGVKMINARSESVAERPAFRDAFARRRCIIPADGFYEWKRTGKSRRPYYFHRPNRELFGFAGLWARFKAADGETLLSFTIITGPANRVVAPVHDRMPIVIERRDYERWLHPNALPPEMLADLLEPAADDVFSTYPVNTYVGSVQNDGPACIERAPEQMTLF